MIHAMSLVTEYHIQDAISALKTLVPNLESRPLRKIARSKLNNCRNLAEDVFGSSYFENGRVCVHDSKENRKRYLTLFP